MIKAKSGISSYIILILYFIVNYVIFCVSFINCSEVFKIGVSDIYHNNSNTNDENKLKDFLSDAEICLKDEEIVSYDVPSNRNGILYYPNKVNVKKRNINEENMYKPDERKKSTLNMKSYDKNEFIKSNINSIADRIIQVNDNEVNNLNKLEQIHTTDLKLNRYSDLKLFNNTENNIKLLKYLNISNFNVESQLQYYNQTFIKNDMIQNVYEGVRISSKIQMLDMNSSNIVTDSLTEMYYNETELQSSFLRKYMNNKYAFEMSEGNRTQTEHEILIEIFKTRYPVQTWLSLGLFTEDYLYSINSHWLGFQPPLHSSHYILAALYCLVMTIGICGNCLVIFMYLRCRSLRVPANTLVMNLAVSDSVMLMKMPIFIFNSLYFGPVLGEPGCQVYGFLGGLTGTVSIMTLAAIALDRYYAIVHPLDPLRKTTRLRARISVLLVWCYGCIFAGLPLTGLGLNHYVPEGYLTSCSFDYLTPDMNNRIFIFIFFIAAWVIPFSVITVCYCGIFREVIKTGSASCRRGQEAEKRRIEIRLAGMVVGVVGLWFLAWTPYAIVALLGIFDYHHLISPIGSMIPALLCKSASCIDPYVYAVTHPRFRREITKLFLPRKYKIAHRYQSRLRYQTEASRVSSIYMPRQDSSNTVELEELKMAPSQNIQPPSRRTWFLSKVPKSRKSCCKNNSRKSLQESKRSVSTIYSNVNSSPF
ncbi:uncharacterized protein LOC142321889 [Lycorma delicatula]|uniref:uncharacterized protein LOC142321889 n=1 Tax=Lycorma delicatula TaxID=130591 RepID=UPI003F50F0C0